MKKTLKARITKIFGALPFQKMKTEKIRNEKGILYNGKNKNAPSPRKLNCSKKLYFNRLKYVNMCF